MENEDPCHRQVPWPSRLKVKVAMSHCASDRCWPISQECKVPETPKLVGRLHIPRAILCTSFLKHSFLILLAHVAWWRFLYATALCNWFNLIVIIIIIIIIISLWNCACQMRSWYTWIHTAARNLSTCSNRTFLSRFVIVHATEHMFSGMAQW